MDINEYNGWTNKSTWLVPLWIDNEYGTYTARIEHLMHADDVIDAAMAKEIASHLLGGSTPDHDDVTKWEDVEWTEIAVHWEEERQEMIADRDAQIGNA